MEANCELCSNASSFQGTQIKAVFFYQEPGFVQHRRHQEFDDLLAPHLNSLTRLVRSKARDGSEADDVVQETLFCAFRHLTQLRDRAYFKPWLFRIAINEIRQRRRSEGRSPILMPAGPVEGLELADMRCSPDVECERAELNALLREALSKLPEKYRRVVEMRDLNDLSVTETAQRLCLGVPATKTRHLRARALLSRSFRQIVARRSRATDPVAPRSRSNFADMV